MKVRIRSLGADRGSGTIWVAAMALVLVAVVLGAGLIGLAQTARHRATSAADLAALAGAQVALLDPGGACAAAAHIAAANGATLTGCALAAEVVTVVVAVRVRLGRFGVGTATAHARAGPVDAAPP